MNRARFDEKELAAAYIAFAQAAEDTPEYREHFWAFNAFADLCVEDPDRAWKAILAVLACGPGPRVIQLLAAGPMEELLVNHGGRVIDRIEQHAKDDPTVASLIGGVWRNDMEDSVWRRIEAVRSHRW